MRDVKVWIMLALFEVAFGLTVFAATRHYYLGRQPPSSSLPSWAVGLGTSLPSAPSSAAPAVADAPPAAAVASASSDDPSALSARAEDAFNAGRYDEAAQSFEQLLADRPPERRALQRARSHAALRGQVRRSP